MITNIQMTTDIQSQPVVNLLARARTIVEVASLRAGSGVVVCPMGRHVDGTTVSAYSGTTAVLVTGAFPGTSAWSPPI